MNKTKTFMVAIMLALALTLATVGMTTLTQYALAFWGGGYYCEAPWARHDPNCYNYSTNNQPTYTQTYAQDCNRWDSNCLNSGYNTQPHYTQVNEINGFDCFGEWRCVNGWNQAIAQAQTDFNAGQGENIACPDRHTDNFCSGWTHGYSTEWNSVSQGQSSTQQQQCANGAVLGPGATVNCGQSSSQGQSG